MADKGETIDTEPWLVQLGAPDFGFVFYPYWRDNGCYGKPVRYFYEGYSVKITWKR